MTIEAPDPSWIPLVRAPFVFRKAIDHAQNYRDGAADEVVVEWVQKSAPRTTKFSLDPAAGVFRVEVVGTEPLRSMVISPDDVWPTNAAPDFSTWMEPSAARRFAQQLFNAWSWMKTEFQNAVACGACRVLARYDDPMGDFITIPPDVFRRCEIRSWGLGDAGLGDKHLYSISVADPAVPGLKALPDQETELSIRTGAPGRPTPIHIVKQEAEQRIKSGNVPTSKTEFSEALSEWLKAEHPKLPPLTPKAIANNLTEIWHNRPLPPEIKISGH